MTKFVVTFFTRDERNRRHYRFPEQCHFRLNSAGQPIYTRGTSPAQIYQMVNWLDEQPLAKTLASYGIKYAFTDICPSSIIIDVKSDDKEELDEMLVTLKLFAGPDIRIKPSDKAEPRRRASELNLTKRDRYAR